VSKLRLALTAASAVALLTSEAALAQGAVTGQVSLLERPGEQSTDLANAVIYLESLSGGATRPKPAEAQRGGAQIAMQSRRFSPRVVLVGVGSKVAFPNQDPFSHNIFSNVPGGSFDLGLYGKGESREAEFKRAGVFPIYCNIHPRMSAHVLSVDTPHAVQAGLDGRFTIPDVPAGRYVAHFWHERAGAQKREITVGGDGLTGVDAQLDARGYRFVQHKNKFGQEYQKGKDRYE
jgi:plastocyanin